MKKTSLVPALSQQKAREFADKWKNTEEEERYAQSFWTDFFQQLCGIDDEQISVTSVYNTFPFPNLDAIQKAKLISVAQEVLQIRKNHQDVTLGDLYDPISMPLELQKAHVKMDELVMKALEIDRSASDADISRELFSLYSRLASDTLI